MISFRTYEQTACAHSLPQRQMTAEKQDVVSMTKVVGIKGTKTTLVRTSVPTIPGRSLARQRTKLEYQ